MSPPDEEVLTVTEVAAIVKCSRSFVFTSILPEVPTLRLGRVVRVKRRDLDAWIASRTHGALHSAEAQRRTEADLVRASLGERLPRRPAPRTSPPPQPIRITQPRTKPRPIGF